MEGFRVSELIALGIAGWLIYNRWKRIKQIRAEDSERERKAHIRNNDC